MASPRKMSMIFNDFFTKKINYIEESFDDNDEDQLDILKRLIPKPESGLDLKFFIVDEMYSAITRMKTSTNSVQRGLR